MTFVSEETVVIGRPVEEVFAFLDHDTERFALWRKPPFVRVTALSPDPPGVGSRYENLMRMFGLRMRMITEVTVHEPPARLGWRQVGRSMAFAEEEGEYRLEPVDGGTRMTFRGSVQPRRPLRPFGRRMTATFDRRYLQPMLRRLKDALDEAPVEASPSRASRGKVPNS